MGSGAILRARSRPSSPCEHLKRTVRFSRVYIVAAPGGVVLIPVSLTYITHTTPSEFKCCDAKIKNTFRPLSNLVWAKIAKTL